MPKYTKKEIIEEIIQCGKDPLYFLNTYAQVQHPVSGLIPFKTYHYQDDIIKEYLKHRENVVLKARQLGVTTITAGYIAWLILLHRDKNVLVVGTKQEVAKNTVRIVRTILKHLPKWLLDMGRIEVNNRNSIELSNGSRVKAVTTTSDVGRSEALSLLFVDECAHIEKMEEIWTGLHPTISTGGCVILASTPLGTGNFFHKIYEQAKRNENNFNCTFGEYINPHDSSESYNDRFMWWVQHSHDEQWFNVETAGKSPRDIAQEMLCQFNASGDTFIFGQDIVRLEQIVSDPMGYFYSNRDVWVWEEPEQGGTYLISCDVSRGDARDYSAFHVLRLDSHPLEQVAEYKGKIRPDKLGILLMSVSQHYNNATIAPENNSGWSGQTILKIEEAQYPFLYYSRKRKPKRKDHRQADPYYAMTRNDYLPGYSVTSANRLPMLSKMEQYIRMGDVKINSPRLVDEIKTFIISNIDRPEAMRGYNDDLVLALAGGLWVRDEAFLHTYRSDEVTKAMIDSMSTSSTKTSQYKDFNYNPVAYNPNSHSHQQFAEQQNKIILANGEIEDLSWLLPGSG